MVGTDDPTRIVLVDDHVLVREGLREILHAQGADLRVVGEAGDSEQAVAVVAETHPHVVLLDVEIPGDDVTVTVRRMRVASPESKVIILSMYDGPQLVQSLLALGIKGYFLKSATRQELVSAIRSARVDDDRILLAVSRDSIAVAQGGRGPGALSQREREVLQLAAEAMSNAQIAARLFLTEATVKRHLRNIFVKLDAVSRIDAVNKAVAASLIVASSSSSAPSSARPASSAGAHSRPAGRPSADR